MTENTVSGDGTAYDDRLAAFVGQVVVPSRPGPDAVNLPMIRHWVHAMGDDNPIHLDEDAARATGRAGIVAPATMVQAFTMPTYVEKMSGTLRSGMSALFELLDEGGYTSVVATDSDYEFVRELALGDLVHVEEVVESISPEKATGLGAGRFITTVRTYRDANGETIATQRWRLLKFRPKAPAPTPVARRPRPGVSKDTAFWWDAASERRLVIQRCTGCHELRHPPGPCCPHCGSFEWDTIDASGEGTVYSYVVGHHPQIPGFSYPLLVALVELAEGTRLVTNLIDVEPDDVEIGMPVRLDWLADGDDLLLPVFRPVSKDEVH